MKEIFKDLDENQKTLVAQLIDEVVYIEKQLEMLRSLPFIRVHHKDSSKQEMTSAGKLYKDLNAQYMNAIRILSSLLRNVSADDFDPVADFMQKMSGSLEVR